MFQGIIFFSNKINDFLGQHTDGRQWRPALFRFILKSGDGRTPPVNIIITTCLVWSAKWINYELKVRYEKV